MLLLLVGLLCLAAALRHAAPGPAAGAPPGAPPGRPGLPRAAGWWAVAIAACALAQLWLARADVTHYRFSLLGLRYRVAEPGPRLTRSPIRIGGDYAATDLHVRGAAARAAELRVHGDTAVRAVTLATPDDGGAAALVRRGDLWHVVGARPVGPGDTVVVQARGAPTRLALAPPPAPPEAAGGGRDPWVANLATGARARLPLVNRSRRDRAFGGRRPWLGERTYPLADVLAATGDSAAAAAALTSFFYFEGDALHLADLDTEVALAGAAGAAGGAAGDTVWAGPGTERPFRIAALPHRDLADADDGLPARGGVAALYGGRVSVRGSWLDVTHASPEVLSFDREELRGLSLPDSGTRLDGRPAWRLRFSGVRGTVARQAVTFDSPPKAFEAGSQAMFLLPQDPSDTLIGVVTPTGRARWAAGRPLPLGDDDRQVLLRVDGQGTSGVFWLVVLAALGLPALLFFLRPLPPFTFGVALAAYGLVAYRLLLGLSAGVEFPFVQEGIQTGVWMTLFLPWLVIALGAPPDERGVPWHRDAHLAYAAAVLAAGWVLFDDAAGGWPPEGKQLVLGAALPLLVLLARRRPRWARRIAAAAGRWAAARRWRLPWPVYGLVAGLALVAARGVLFLFGRHEAVPVLGERFALSIVYTPAVILLLGWVLRRHARRLREGRAHAASWLVLDVWGYLALAFGLTAVVVSDIGIALATQLGALVFLAVFAWPALGAAAPAGRARGALRLALAFPLVAFAVLQLRPELGLSPADLEQSRYALREWDANRLRILGQSNPDALQAIGQRRSEALGVMYETMKAYTRGPGAGYFRGEVSRELTATATQEHVVSALVASQWGLAGTAGLVLLLAALAAAGGALALRPGPGDPLPPEGVGRYGPPVPLPAQAEPRGWLPALALGVGLWAATYPVSLLLRPPWSLLLIVLAPAAALLATLVRAERLPASVVAEPNAAPAADRLPAPPRLAAALCLLTLAFAGVYMVLANYALVAFTGKNVYVLGLDSIGDILESSVLLGAAAWGATRPAAPERATETMAPEGAA